MTFLKYTAVGIAGGFLLIVLAKGILAHLLQRRSDYYENGSDKGGEPDA